jgi:hypothetical protein
MKKEHLNRIENLYKHYINIIKPLLCDYEVRAEKFPLSIFNDIMSFVDHISRCYLDGVETDRIGQEISAAERHLKRTTLDLYKLIIVQIHTEIENFEIQARKLDLTKIENGVFYLKYRELKNKSIAYVREARKSEYTKTDFNYVYSQYEEAYIYFNKLLNLIEKDLGPIKEIRKELIYEPIKKSIFSSLKWIVLTVISTIISIILTIVFYDNLKQLFKK